jgi:hypothetical protein
MFRALGFGGLLGLLFFREGGGGGAPLGGGGGGGGGGGTPGGNLNDLLFFSIRLMILFNLSIIIFLLLEVTPFDLDFLHRVTPFLVYSI